jgi:hypothetical protein
MLLRGTIYMQRPVIILLVKLLHAGVRVVQAVPHYSPRCYVLFVRVKETFWGRRFESAGAIKSLIASLRRLNRDDYRAVIDLLLTDRAMASNLVGFALNMGGQKQVCCDVSIPFIRYVCKILLIQRELPKFPSYIYGRMILLKTVVTLLSL